MAMGQTVYAAKKPNVMKETAAITASSFAGALKEAADGVNSIPGAQVTVTPTGTDGQYQLNGTINGMSLPTSELYSFKDGVDEWGYTSYWFDPDGNIHVEIFIKEQALRMQPTASRIMLLYHEAYHAALAHNFPDFSDLCSECAHQLVYASTAASLCALANKCPPAQVGDPPKPLDAHDRKELVSQANSEREKCEKKRAKEVCESCTVAIKPPIPPDCGAECVFQDCAQ